MDVRCEKCGTEYELDDVQVTEQGVTVKCTQCGHIFRVVRKSQTAPRGVPVKVGSVPSSSASSNVASAPTVQAPSAGGAPGATAPKTQAKAAAKQWFIRKASGETFRFRELTTLQQWIVEEKVGKDDEISRTGRSWEKLGAIEELKPFFMVVEQARLARKAALRATEPEAASLDEHAFSGEEDMPTAQVSSGGKGSGRFELGDMPKVGNQGPVELGDSDSVSGSPEPKWGETAASSSQPQTLPDAGDEQDDYFERRRKSKGRLLGIAIGLVALLVLGVVAAWNWDKLMGLVTSPSKPEEKDLLAHPKDLLRQDGFGAFDQAFEILEGIYQRKHLPDARGLQAETFAIKALYLQFRVQDLNQRADRISEQMLRIQADVQQAEKNRPRRSGKKRAAEGASMDKEKGKALVKELQGEIKRLHRKAARLQKEADGLADRALTYAREALSAASTSVTQRAMAEALLAKGGSGREASAHLNKAMALGPEDPDNYAARAMFEMAHKRWQTAQKTIETALEIAGKTGRMYYRGSYLLARVLVAQGKGKAAAERLAAILATNDKHDAARALKADIERPLPSKPVSSLAQSRPAATVDAGVVPARPRGTGIESGEEGGGGEDDYDALVRKGDRYSENGRVADAKRYYQRALKLRSGGVEALTGLAYCHLDRGQRSQAVRMFRRALANSPSFGDALIGLAETYKSMGRLHKALKYYQRYLDSHPGGSKSGLARRNVEEIKDKLGPKEGGQTTPVVVEPGAGSPGGSGAATTSPSSGGTTGGGAGSQAPSGTSGDQTGSRTAPSSGGGASGSGGGSPSSPARPSGSGTGSGGSSGASGSSGGAAPRNDPRKPAGSGSGASSSSGSAASGSTS